MGFFSKKSQPKQKTAEEIAKEAEEAAAAIQQKEDALRDKAEENKSANEKQVELAYRFMMQPDVQKATDLMKRNFLRKKGLTHLQIDLAFARRDQKASESQVQKPEESQNSQINPEQPLAQTSAVSVVAKVEIESLEQKLERAYKTGFLSLKNSSVTVIEAKVFEVTPLKTLLLSQNILSSIPDDIEKLVNLRIIHLSECGLTDDLISLKLFNLPNLLELNLSKNKLTHVTQIGNLQTLSRCDLSDNDLVELPEEISNCSKLQVLNLANNHLSFFPISFVKITSLKKLSISGNNFDTATVASLQNSGIEGLFKHLAQ